MDDLCKSLSTIPFKSKIVPVSDLTSQLRAAHVTRDIPTGFDSLASNQVAAWCLAASPPDFLSENFFPQMSSPSCMIARREGTLLEHAIAFCSILLGMEENAYVAIGNVKKRCYIWVIILKPKVESSQLTQEHISSEKFEMDQNSTYTYGSSESRQSFRVEDFTIFSKTESIRKFNDSTVVLHYDIATGNHFQYVPEKKFPFDRISTLFNNRNIWYNIQHTDLIPQYFLNYINLKSSVFMGFIKCRVLVSAFCKRYSNYAWFGRMFLHRSSSYKYIRI